MTQLQTENVVENIGGFIIGSINDAGMFLNAFPVVYMNRASVFAEAERLSMENPGKRVIVFYIEGTVIVPTPSPVWNE